MCAGLPIALALRDAGKDVFFATETMFEVGAVIEALREELPIRPRRAIPH